MLLFFVLLDDKSIVQHVINKKKCVDYVGKDLQKEFEEHKHTVKEVRNSEKGQLERSQILCNYCLLYRKLIILGIR